MRMIDPTYIRTIYDGLLLGTLHKDNASGLPMGLVGMYEEALPPASNVNERKKFLDFFAVWALLKKEVSVAFLMALLEGWSEETIIYYINKYSKWFNSPQSGKYVLYHERLRAFILQKISKQQFNACNETIIIVSHDALSRRSGDEWENYALEYLSNHMLIPAIEKGDGSVLKLLAYNTTHWNRQVEISKGFEWSKRLLNNMMLWASKYDDEEVIECALNKVDLHHQEQNDAPRIVELVAQNDIETALDRIDKFGGQDKEGLQRKFILYMLCLMELTLLNSKDKVHRKTAIEKLLNNLDEQISTDTSLIDWNDFFPSYTMFLMACEWAKMGLDYLVVYKRTNHWIENWIEDWIEEKGPFSDFQFQVLTECARGIRDESYKSRALKETSIELAKQGKIEESIACARGFSGLSYKSMALKEISTELAKQGKIEEAVSAMRESLACARAISDESKKSRALKEISTELAKQGKIEEAATAMQESLACARGIIDESYKSTALKEISTELAKQGKVEEAVSAMHESLAYARGIIDESYKSRALMKISTELAKQGKIEEAASVMQESLACARRFNFTFLTRDSGRSKESYKSAALIQISTELAKQGKIEEAASAMQESLAFAADISDMSNKSSALIKISTELAKQGKIEEALACARGISNEKWKSRGRVGSYKSMALKDISTELAKQGKIEEAASAMQESLAFAADISAESEKSRALKDISIELAKQGKTEQALACATGISNESDKSRTLNGIYTELAKQGKNEEAASAMQQALACARGISDESKKSMALKEIYIELAKQGKIEEALICARFISNKFYKSEALNGIYTEMAKQGKIEEALACALGISDESDKSSALRKISTELAKQGKYEEAASAMQQALACALGMGRQLIEISTELVKQGKFEEAASAMQESLACVKVNRHEPNYIRPLKEIISTELAKQGKIEQALACARGIINEKWKSRALNKISTELAKQGNLQIAEITGLEILLIAERQSCWKEIGKSIYIEKGYYEAIQTIEKINSSEFKRYFKTSVIEQLDTITITKENLLHVLEDGANEISSIEHVLQMYALNQLFFAEIIEEKVQRLNLTLDIQWAIDIKNSFNAN